MSQPGFMIYADDWENYLNDYSSQEVGEMLKSLLGYFLTGEVTEFADRGMRQFFRQSAKGIDLDRKRYDNKCLQNAYNRYRGTCKKKNTEPLSYEEWMTTVNEGQEPSTTVNESFSISITNTNNQQSITNTNNQQSKANNQQSKGMQGEKEQFIDRHAYSPTVSDDFMSKMAGYGK